MSYFVHPQGLCESHDVGEGTRIWGFAHVMEGAKVGARCNLGEQVFVEAGAVVGSGCTLKNGCFVCTGVTIEDDVFLGPYVIFTNDLKPRAFAKKKPAELVATRIERGATLGAQVTVVCGVRVGRYAFVGAGAVLTADVPAHSLVVGNPGRIVGRVCYCGERLDERDYCTACRTTLSDHPLA